MNTYKKQTLAEWCMEDAEKRAFLLDEWDDEENEKEGYRADNILRTNMKYKAFWRCKKCGRRFRQFTGNRTYLRHGCNNCRVNERHASYVGKTYGCFTITKDLGVYIKPGNKNKNWYVECRCEKCGNTKIMPAASVLYGKALSCGCVKSGIKEEKKRNVYILTCIANGKKLAGYTTEQPIIYFMQGKRFMRNKLDRTLADDIERYGWDSFTYEIVCQTGTKKEADLKVRELVENLCLTDTEKGYNGRFGARSSWSRKRRA